MAKVRIKFSETTKEQRREILKASRRKLSFDESLEILLNRMRELESRYGMSTLVFYPKFINGKMGDDRDFIVWAGTYETYQDLLRERFDSAGLAKAA